MKKERGILFQIQLVKAILLGIKSMTRRMKGLEFINECPEKWFHNPALDYDNVFTFSSDQFHTDKDIECPYGNVGDILWVRETHAFTDTGYIFKADFSGTPKWKWVSSRFMPKKAARIWLEITDVSVEKLNDITEQDAIKEGCEDLYCYSPDGNFLMLWKEINGPGSLSLNPWVWVITFKVLSITGRPDNLNQPLYKLNNTKCCSNNKAEYQTA